MPIPYKSILITGGAGFVGTNISLALKEAHPEVRVLALDNLKRRGSELNLGALRERGVEFVHGDVRNREDLLVAGKDVDLILECSAEPTVLAGHGGDSPDYVVNTNLMGTINCLELARRNRADMLFLSTSRVYPVQQLNGIATTDAGTRFALDPEQHRPGLSNEGISEMFSLEGPRSLYGATKLCSELLIEEYAAMYDVRAVVNRCSVVAGPRQMGKLDQGVFTLWVVRHHFQWPLSYIGWGGEGKQVRDVLHVDDLAELVGLQLSRFEELAGQTFNVGGGAENSLSLLETTQLCCELTGHTVPMTSERKTRPFDIKWYVTDNHRVTEATGWSPRTSASETLTSIAEWVRTTESELRPVFSPPRDSLRPGGR
jgi:CDP-paratose 2-epimerase